MNCAFCQSPMKDHESNNPAPFIFDEDSNRVCRNCNDFVTATRFFAKTREQVEHIQVILAMAFSLRLVRKESMKQFKELLKQQEE